MNNLSLNCGKVANKTVNKFVEKVREKVVGNLDDLSFPYISTNFSEVLHMIYTSNSTRKNGFYSLLNVSFTHFPHSLLLLLLN